MTSIPSPSQSSSSSCQNPVNDHMALHIIIFAFIKFQILISDSEVGDSGKQICCTIEFYDFL